MATKTCTICRIEKPATPEFFANGVTTLDGMRQQCKACWSLSNLRPLWAADNIAKRAKREYLI